jgi:ribulose 1,5-bisphosphate synthetase/thiazole synthase
MTKVLVSFVSRMSDFRLQDQQVDVLIIGAGPTGLGAAKRLNDLVLCLDVFLTDSVETR